MLASKTAELCGVLSHPTRYNILKSLTAAETDGISQRQLTLNLSIARSSLKRHIDPMVKIGIVTVERQSRAVIYRAEPHLLADFIQSLKRHFELEWVLRMVEASPSELRTTSSLRDRLDDVASEEKPDSDESEQ